MTGVMPVISFYKKIKKYQEFPCYFFESSVWYIGRNYTNKMKGMELDMKKIVPTIILLLIMVVMLGCTQVYAAENVIDAQNESKLIEIKENAAKTLEEYKQKYGSDAYGLTAYILNLVRIYSIPFCFLGIAVSAIYQYVIGIRKLDTQEKGLIMMISFITILVICQILPLAFAIVIKFGRG